MDDAQNLLAPDLDLDDADAGLKLLVLFDIWTAEFRAWLATKLSSVDGATYTPSHIKTFRRKYAAIQA